MDAVAVTSRATLALAVTEPEMLQLTPVSIVITLSVCVSVRQSAWKCKELNLAIESAYADTVHIIQLFGPRNIQA